MKKYGITLIFGALAFSGSAFASVTTLGAENVNDVLANTFEQKNAQVAQTETKPLIVAHGMGRFGMGFASRGLVARGFGSLSGGFRSSSFDDYYRGGVVVAPGVASGGLVTYSGSGDGDDYRVIVPSTGTIIPGTTTIPVNTGVYYYGSEGRFGFDYD